MSNIKDIVEQVQETPSPRCWESIASQLPAAGTAIGGGAAATAAKGSIAASKLAAIIGSATAVVTVVTVTTVVLLKNEPATDLQANDDNTPVATAIDTVSADDTTLYIAEETSSPASSNEPSIPASTTTSKETPVASSTPSTRREMAEVAPTPSSTTATTASASTNTPTTPSSSTPKAEPSPMQQNTTVATPATHPSHSQAESGTTGKQQEPVVETIEDHYSGYSQPIMIEIPNIFTPNGDGMNDLFVIKGIEHCDKRVLIVKDQKGQTVFQSQHYDNNWDGSDLPNGSYYYQFVYSINNINELRKGTVLIRR